MSEKTKTDLVYFYQYFFKNIKDRLEKMVQFKSLISNDKKIEYDELCNALHQHEYMLSEILDLYEDIKKWSDRLKWKI